MTFFFANHQVSSVQGAPGWLFDIGDEQLPNYTEIFISQYKDPYKSISIMERHKGLVHAAQLFFSCFR